ncbi:MAG: hypothetical protein V7K89_00350 [Nostoc sp.]|uniref:hypothetical protein n=1 Tax=Nostoc sp. TaxID=1180 RepID=UPI002FF75F0C
MKIVIAAVAVFSSNDRRSERDRLKRWTIRTEEVTRPFPVAHPPFPCFGATGRCGRVL